LTEFLVESPDNLLVFKLASIAHVRTQGNGSGADIAASTYHGTLKYTSFQAEWLLEEIALSQEITPLVEKDWIYLSLESVQIPKELTMYVGWTGKAASTKHLVTKIKKMKNKAYEAFLEASEKAVTDILQGMRTGRVNLFLDGIRDNREALAAIGVAAGVDIETPKLNALAMEAEKLAGAGKLSGAGGGDCGIVFIPKGVDVNSLFNQWSYLDITPLDLAIYDRESYSE